MVNTKQIGNDFEKQFGKCAQALGFYALFINPNRAGAQPFDFIVAKNGRSYAIDCKTCVGTRFTCDRVEDNQALAMARWCECGNTMPYFAVLHHGEIYMIPWEDIKDFASVKICDYMTFTQWVKWEGAR